MVGKSGCVSDETPPHVTEGGRGLGTSVRGGLGSAAHAYVQSTLV